MEKNEMLIAWNDLQSRVETLTAINRALQSRVNEAEMRRVRRRAMRSPISDLVLGALGLVCIGSFAAGNFERLVSAPVTALPAITLAAIALVLVNFAIRQLMWNGKLNFASPITEAQAAFAEIRKLRLQSTRWMFILALPAWFVFPLFIGQWLIRVDLVYSLNAGWVLGNLAVGLALLPVLNWGLKKSRYAMSLQDALVGKDILEAESFLREIRDFQTE